MKNIKPITIPQVVTKDGFKTKYHRTYADQVYRLAILGLKKSKICDQFGIIPETFERWLKKHKKFREAYNNGKDVCLQDVAISLYNKATGYESEETKINVIDGKIVETVIQKHVQPDVNAIKMVLHNRAPDEWKNDPETQINIQQNLDFNIKYFGEDDED